MKQIIFLLLILISTQAFAQNFARVAVGEKAADFKLKTIQGDEVQLNEIIKNQTVVLVVLRGWPEYQCPACTRQVGALLTDADKFAEHKASVLMVYPGPSENMQEHAKEFSADFVFPENFHFTLDPDYKMINKYGLRWDAQKETAYPSTFVINKKGEIVFSKVSTTHGGRASNEEIFKALGKL
jgi:peroxiredoxin